MRSIREPFVVATPTGARVRARLRLSAWDKLVVRAVAEHLGRLAGRDLAWRCRLGHTQSSRLGSELRADRKRALTSASSSRWAGAITRTSNDQVERAYKNLLDSRVGLRRAVKRIRSRLAVPVVKRSGRVRGYATRVERFEKQRRLQHLQARLGKVEQRITAGRVSVCRGGRRLAKLRHHLDDSGATTPTEAERAACVIQWRARWQAARLFLTADGEADKAWGNETIRVHPDEGWLELRLPTPLAHLTNTPGRAPTYRLSCRVQFTHRAAEWAAQATSGAVRYDIHVDPNRSRWYLDASWRLPARVPPALSALRQHPTLGLDLNADHLAGWILDACGNPIDTPHTIPLDLDGHSATTRDGRLRAAIADAIRTAKANGCHSIAVENLDFTDVRRVGRETLGRGRRGRRFRHTIAGIPTRKFRDLLVGMATNAGLWVLAVDPAYTSRWGAAYWQAPLGGSTRPSITVTRHHAAAVVIGRRGLGFAARRRPGVTRLHQRMGKGELPARPSVGRWAVREPGPPEASGQRHRPRKTRHAERRRLGDQVAQDRSGPPEQSADSRLLTS